MTIAEKIIAEQPRVGERTILLVDDDLDMLESMRVFMKARGFAVELARSAAEARKAVTSHQPTAIVLDIMMEHDSAGFDFAYELQANPATRRIPIIIVSGFMQLLDQKLDQFQYVLAREWPAAKLFQKPVRLGDLATSLEDLIYESQRTSSDRP